MKRQRPITPRIASSSIRNAFKKSTPQLLLQLPGAAIQLIVAWLKHKLGL